MKKLFLSAVLLLASVCAFGQGATAPFQPAVNQNGSFLSFATITFCSIPTTINTLGVCQTPISVFKDQALTQPYGSAIQTDGIGYFPPNANTATSLWFNPGTYCYTLTTTNMLSPATNPCIPFSLGVPVGGIFPSITVTGNILGSLNTVLCLNGDTGLDRNNPGWWNMGNCTPGDQSGTLSLSLLFDDQNYIASGTAAQPSRAFKADSASGMYYAGGGVVGIAGGGVASATFSATGVAIPGALGVTGTSTLGVVNAGATSTTSLTATGNATAVLGQNQFKAYTLNSVLWVDGIKYTTLAGCYADIPSTGGVCNVPPGYTETLAASITMNKNGAGFAFQGPAVITMGSNHFVVSAGTHGAFITGPMDQGGQACVTLPCTTYTNSTKLAYTGTGAAILIGAATPATQHPKIRGLYIDLTGAGNGAQGVDVIATAGHFDISQNFILGSGGAGNTQVGITLDGGGTTFTCDGEIDENFIINTLTGIKTANMSCENVYKGNQIACNPGSTPATIGIDFEDNTFGNTILGGNYSACSVIWKVAGTSNANYGIFPVNQETTDATFAAGTSINVAVFLPQVGGGSNNPPVVTDSGINNTYSIGVTVPVRGYVRQVSAVSAIGTTTIFTTQGANTLYKFDIAVACDSASAAATVSVTVKFTDPSNTVQTLTGLAPAACNALGGSSVASVSFPFIAKASTVVQYSTVIANTPTYDLRIAVTQFGTN